MEIFRETWPNLGWAKKEETKVNVTLDEVSTKGPKDPQDSV